MAKGSCLHRGGRQEELSFPGTLAALGVDSPNRQTAGGDNPSYAKQVPTLIWTPVRAGETTPPHVIGEPTTYIVMDDSVPGGRAKLDAPNVCLEYQSQEEPPRPHGFFLSEDSDEDAKKAILAANSQYEYFVKAARVALANAEANKQAYLDETPEAERSPTKIAELDQDIARKQGEVDATEANLAKLVAKLETECARAYPEVENLTTDDNRWYQMAQTTEREPAER